jgi:serine phosphatase RsbU (regulator of sigma subunit)
MREKIMLLLHQRGKLGEANDGLDIALILLDEENLKLQYAGANSPMYIVREDRNTFKITRYKPDKMPIGIHYNSNKPFKNIDIELLTGDTIYISTDGYVDQFGGTEGKKYMSKNFKEKLISIQEKTMVEQKNILEDEIMEWKGKNEQVDDILIIGVRIFK